MLFKTKQIHVDNRGEKNLIPYICNILLYCYAICNDKLRGSQRCTNNMDLTSKAFKCMIFAELYNRKI